MKLLIDMNLSPLWVHFLEANGMEAAHWSSVGPPKAPDATIMQFAVSHGYVILTQDLDFGIMLASSGSSRPSVVQLRSPEVKPSIVGDLVVRSVKQTSSDLDKGALLTIDSKRTRVRLLPLQGPYERT